MAYITHTHNVPEMIALPRPHSVLAVALVNVARTVATWDQRRHTRKHLKALPDHLFSDIGISPEAARLEASKFFWRA